MTGGRCDADACRFDQRCGLYEACIRVDPPPLGRSRIDPLLVAYAVLVLAAAAAFVAVGLAG